MLQTFVRRAIVGTRRFSSQETMAAMSYEMKHSKDEFVHYVNQAALNKQSPEREHLYRYLNRCFVDNDTDYDGLVSYRGFNAMIAEAAVAPRRFGFAPHTRELYVSKEEYDLARTDLFNKLKSDSGRITLENWIKWGMKHVEEKVGKGLEEHSKPRWLRSKADCMDFFKGVLKEKSSHNMKSSTSTQYKEFYLLVNQKFLKCDSSNTGLMNKADFDKMKSMMNEIPKAHGMDWFMKMSFEEAKMGKSGVGLKECIQVCLKVVKAHQ